MAKPRGKEKNENQWENENEGIRREKGRKKALSNRTNNHPWTDSGET